MKRWMVFAAVVAGLAVIGSAGFYGYRSSQAQKAPVVQAPPTVAVSKGDVQLTVTAPGKSVDVSAKTLESQVNGQVEELNVRPGDAVQAGQVLARIGDPAQFETAVNDAQIDVVKARQALDGLNPAALLSQAELDLIQAQKNLEKAQNKRASADYQRGSKASIEAAQVDLLLAEQMLDQAQRDYDGVANRPETDYGRVMALSRLAAARQQRDRAQINLNYLTGKPNAQDIAQVDTELALAQEKVKTAQAKVDQLKQGAYPDLVLAQAQLKNAQNALEKAKANQQNREIKAPFSGVVIEVKIQAGQTIQAGAPAITLTDPKGQEVEATVVEEDLPLVSVGQPVGLFFDALPDQTVKGKISRIVPRRISGDRALYTIGITLDQVPDHLVEGMTVDGSVVISEKKGVLRLPRSVIHAHADGTAGVEVWTGEQIEKRTIKVGQRGDSFVEVLSGLAEGELVVAR